MKIRFLFPEGKKKCFTLSYDDGSVHDRRLVSILNRFGIKGTFHLNSGVLENDWHIHVDEIPELYKGHEISCHGVNHPFLERIPAAELVHEILEDRKNLEAIAGYPVLGMSYPYGTWDDSVLQAARSLGIVYSRTTAATGNFQLPKDWLLWHPTAHHSHDVMAKAKTFRDLPEWQHLASFYVWGHSFEFDRENNWSLMEDLCAFMADMPGVWLATNIEIYRYVTALRRLEFSTDSTMVHNPSACTLWLFVDDRVISVPGGQSLKLQ